jgi:DNA replication protein DnaC
MSPGSSQTSSNTDHDPNVCSICGKTPICHGLGVMRYDVPLGDPRFGKLFRCPNNPVDSDTERQEKLRKISNLSAFGAKTFANFNTDLRLTPPQQMSLEMAFKVAMDFAQNPDGWLLLEGTYGCGKTHLAAAVGNARLEQGDMVLFVTAPDLLDHLRSAYGPSSEIGYDETFDRVRNAPLLILDDLGVENPSQWAQEKLFQLFNYRYSHRIPTVITTNTDLDKLDDRIRSRLLDVNLMRRVKIDAPDYRSSVQNERDQLLSNLAYYGDMTFETFDPISKLAQDEQKNLQDALNVALDYARNPRGWLVLMGTYGCGKTHLAAAIAHYRQEQGLNVMFITTPDLLDYLRVTYNPGSNVNFDQRFQAVRNAPLLVLDDLGVESASPWAREKLFQIIDHRYVTQLPTIITTAKEIEDINARIISRILDERRCTIFAITGPGYAVRQKRRDSRGSR